MHGTLSQYRPAAEQPLKEIIIKSTKTPFRMPFPLAALLAGGRILAATSHAAPASGADGKPRCGTHQGQDVQSRMQERRTQHLAALKEKPKLAPEQGAAWNAFTAAMQPGMRHADADRLAAMSQARHA